MVPIGLESKIPNDNTEKSVHFVLTIYNMQSLQSEQGCGCKSNIASVLFDSRVTLILADGIGAGVINVLNNLGIQVIYGCSGNAQVIVKQFVQEKISDSGVSCLQHEHHNRDGQDQKCNY